MKILRTYSNRKEKYTPRQRDNINFETVIGGLNGAIIGSGAAIKAHKFLVNKGKLKPHEKFGPIVGGGALIGTAIGTVAGNKIGKRKIKLEKEERKRERMKKKKAEEKLKRKWEEERSNQSKTNEDENTKD